MVTKKLRIIGIVAFLLFGFGGWAGYIITTARLRASDERLQDTIKQHFKQLENIRGGLEDVTRGLEYALERGQGMARDAEELAAKATGLEQRIIKLIGKANGYTETIRGIIEAIERLGNFTQSLYEQTVFYRKRIEAMEK